MNHPIQTSRSHDPLSSTRMLAVVLMLVFLVEYVVMFLVLPQVLPADVPEHLEALTDATLLTFGLAPLLWFVIVRPLRQTAVGERARAASIIMTAADGIITMDRKATIHSINPAMEKILGWTETELLGEPITRVFADDFAGQCGSLMDTTETPGGRLRNLPEIEIAGLARDGGEVPLTISLSSFEIGEQRFLTAIVHDLTDRRRAEAEIAARARQQAAVAQLGQHALAGMPLSELLNDITRRVCDTLDTDGCLILERERGGTLTVRACAGEAVTTICNGRYERSVDELSVWLPAELKTYDLERDPAADTAPGSDLRNAGLSSVTTVMIERPGGAFGALLTCRIQGEAPGRDARDFMQSVSNVVGSALQREQAERERREKETIRAEQMATIAQVATGVAHEIRNPLTSVKMICQALHQDMGDDSTLGRDCEIMVDEIRRMEESLNVFLDYSRPTRAEFNDVDLADLLDRTSRLMQGRCDRQQVELVTKLPDANEPLIVFADSGQLQQLLLNLSLNSLAAMPQGGLLRYSVERNDSCMAITVSDTGPGVPDEVRDRIFEPFFTTKETGVGLGLVICQRIAQEHRGRLDLKPGRAGAEFVLQLPIPARTSGTE